jgi:hypothetical protein
LGDEANRLKALWKSGRDKYASFFVVLGEVQKEVGKDKLGAWCYHHFRMPLHVVMKMSAFLAEADRNSVGREFAGAIASEKQQKAEKQSQEQRAMWDAAIKRRQESLQNKSQKKRGPAAVNNAELSAAAERIRELEAQVATLTAAKQKPRPQASKAPQRDRRDYMREFMRKKRAAAAAAH